MSIALRSRGDRLPKLEPIPGLVVHRVREPSVMAALQQKSIEEMTKRFGEGNRAYVAHLGGAPAAWGWVATRRARIGELESTFMVSRGQRYLWNFVTLPANRGMGIYPRLLDKIVRAEVTEADQFWIAYAPENHASGAGIRKAGFVDIAELSFDAAGRPAVKDLVAGGGRTASAFLGLRDADETLAHCWRCVKKASMSPASCSAGPCECDYQRPISGCEITRNVA